MIIINIDLLYIILDKEKAIATLEVFLSIWMITLKHFFFYIYSSKIIYKQFIRSTIPIQNY